MSHYGFGKVIDRGLDKADILRLVPEERLWRHYLGFDFEVGKTYKSPLRTDPGPSFSIFKSKYLGDKIMAKDHGGSFVGDIFDYIQFTEHVDFYNALVKINLDFGLGFPYNKERQMKFREHKANTKVTTTRVSTPKKSTPIIYESVHRPALQADLDYWGSFGISRATLNLYRVRCVGVLYCNGMCVYTNTPGDPCYEYYFPSGNRKYYRPFAQRMYKFRGNIDNLSDIQGFYQCSVAAPKVERKVGELLVLTKSLKDIMLFREYGIDAVAIHGETQKFDARFMAKLKRWYKKVVCVYDRDKGGMCGAKYLWKEYGVDWLFIRGAKDITDLYKKDKTKADEFIDKLRQQQTTTCVQ